jgi:hypothetical protein
MYQLRLSAPKIPRKDIKLMRNTEEKRRADRTRNNIFSKDIRIRNLLIELKGK